MPTLIEIRDDLIGTPSGGVMIDDTKYDLPYIEYLIHQYRARAIFQSWLTTKRINPLWTQQFIATYDENAQDVPGAVVFNCPAPISLDSMMDGFLYIGKVDGNCAYTKVVSRAEMANQNLHRYSKCVPGNEKALWSDGRIEVYGNTMLKELRVDGILENPELVPTYNKNFDQYPISNDILVIMKDLLMKEQINVMTQTTSESSTDNPKRPNQ